MDWLEFFQGKSTNLPKGLYLKPDLFYEFLDDFYKLKLFRLGSWAQ
jgi:hypothetical protein